MKIFYGCADFTSFAHLPSDIAVMISAATVWKYGDKPIIQSSSRFRERFLDSGGFGFNVYGEGYPFSPEEYLQLVAKFQPDYFATLDYPCEPQLEYEPKNVWDRIDATIDYAAYLLERKTSSICVPVVQGWQIEHYDYCIHQMEKRGIVRPYMAVGSICMRKKFADYAEIVEFVWRRLQGKVKLHFFGLKIRAVSAHNGYLRNFIASFDTNAWLWGRKGEDRLPRKASEKMGRFQRYRRCLEKEMLNPYQLSFSM